MEIIVQQSDLTQAACDVLVVNLFEGQAPGGTLAAVDRALDGWLSRLIAQDDFKGKANTMLEAPTYGKIPAKRVLVVGLGKSADFSLEQVRRAAATAIKRAKGFKARTVATLLHSAGSAGLDVTACAQAVTEGSLLGAYDFCRYKSEPKDEPRSEIAQVLIIEQDAAKTEAVSAGVTRGRIIADAVNATRDLANEPPDAVTPRSLAETAKNLATQYGLACEVWDLERINLERMHCLAMVGRGSAHEPAFIRVDYTPARPAKRICLVGKGVCYDSGGLSLKPQDFLKHMKTDMSGAAAVLGVLRVVAQLKLNVAVTGLIPACENMIDGRAYKVDDVLRARNGKTIEVDNTDAEGRLILADALSYAAEQGFDQVIDIATLTGGCVVALAHVWTGLMGNNQALIDSLLAAGAAVGEKAWMLPFDQEVRDMLDSDMADMKNSGGREGSAIQGGMFLQEFAGEQPWVHMDIAGTSYLDKPRPYEPKGATGVPVRTLVELIERLG